VFAGDQQKIVLKAIRIIHPDFVPEIRKQNTQYSCNLLQDINSANSSVSKNLTNFINH